MAKIRTRQVSLLQRREVEVQIATLLLRQLPFWINMMMKLRSVLLFLVLLILGNAVGTARPEARAAVATVGSSPYEVVWDSPSEDCTGTMPLGNGEVALNAWIEPSGDLRFYLARTDSWDDNGRLLKIGAVRVRVGDGSVGRTKTFRQTLTVKNGTLTARYGQGGEQVEMRLWVDANRPVVCAEIETIRPGEATASIEIWRTNRFTLPDVEVSDVMRGSTNQTVVEPDAVLSGLKDRIGWYHRNIKSVGPELCAKIQGVADFRRPDPLLHRTFGALITTDRPERIDDRALHSRAGTRHVFEIFVHTKHPATEAQWLAEAKHGLDQARAVPLDQRRAAHDKWWADFWDRSWIHITANGPSVKSVEDAGFPPVNRYPVRIGMDQKGGSRFKGSFGRVGIYEAALPDKEVQQLASQGPEVKAASHPTRLYSAVPEGPKALPELAGRTFAGGLTVEAWIKFDAQQARSGMRIADKLTPGKGDGFLFDTHPGSSLRLIVGRSSIAKSDVLSAGAWHHVAATVSPTGRLKLFLDGRGIAATGVTATSVITEGDDAFVVSRAYALQRYISACAGRGRYPVKFNGSLFTVPAEGAPGDADYRRWGPGYWWQNTRLPYYSMCAAGDFEMMKPLFRMYGEDLMPFFKFRTRRYLNHDGAYIPECIYFWGDMFSETYGWQPFEERTDKLQASGWHKWEWVSGLELAGLMLDYCDHAGDTKYLKQTVLPVAHEILTFFNQQYSPGPDGKLYMHPAQSLETWWYAVNPMPEVAGLHALAARLLALPEKVTTAKQRAFWRAVQARLPDLPTSRTDDGKVMLAAAKEFKDKHNIENPELYAVFPFRQVGLGRPHLDWGVEALQHRLTKGAQGWRQDDVFMAWLGLTNEARDYVVQRARSKHAASRFPVFWGPNYDWVPDQDHGSILLVAVQSLLLQSDGQQIHLLPAWPADWNADFKLHAPRNTTVSGRVEHGKLVELDVQPASRRADVKVWGGQ